MEVSQHMCAGDETDPTACVRVRGSPLSARVAAVGVILGHISASSFTISLLSLLSLILTLQTSAYMWLQQRRGKGISSCQYSKYNRNS